MRNSRSNLLHIDHSSLKYLLLSPGRGKLPKADVRPGVGKRNETMTPHSPGPASSLPGTPLPLAKLQHKRKCSLDASQRHLLA